MLMDMILPKIDIYQGKELQIVLRATQTLDVLIFEGGVSPSKVLC